MKDKSELVHRRDKDEWEVYLVGVEGENGQGGQFQLCIQVVGVPGHE